MQRRAFVLVAVLLASLLAFVNAVQAASGDAHTYATQLGDLINAYRERQGLQPLALEKPLSGLAQAHATRMAREHRLSHEGFQQRLASARSPRCVENVGWNAGTPQSQFEAWRNSPTHDHNLRDARITTMGIGIEGGYVAFLACR